MFTRELSSCFKPHLYCELKCKSIAKMSLLTLDLKVKVTPESIRGAYTFMHTLLAIMHGWGLHEECSVRKCPKPGQHSMVALRILAQCLREKLHTSKEGREEEGCLLSVRNHSQSRISFRKIPYFTIMLFEELVVA